MSLNYTPLRHKMLAKVAAGEVSRGLSADGWAFSGPLPSKRGHCERAVDGLVSGIQLAQIPAGGNHRTPLELTEYGETLLAEWSSRQHGEPQ